MHMPTATLGYVCIDINRQYSSGKRYSVTELVSFKPKVSVNSDKKNSLYRHDRHSIDGVCPLFGILRSSFGWNSLGTIVHGFETFLLFKPSTSDKCNSKEMSNINCGFSLK